MGAIVVEWYSQTNYKIFSNTRLYYMNSNIL